MFYVKTELAGGMTVTTEITDANVFTQCPDCGAEIQIDLVELFGDGEGDLFGTGVYCSKCSVKREQSQKSNGGLPISLNGLAFAASILENAGYGEKVEKLCDEYEADSIWQLDPADYDLFARDLDEVTKGVHGGNHGHKKR
jgi:hypothetical protein